MGVVWREFLWGGIAGGFGEGMMHPVDTVKTRIQSQAILSGSQVQIQNVKILAAIMVDMLLSCDSVLMVLLLSEPKEHIANGSISLGC